MRDRTCFLFLWAESARAEHKPFKPTHTAPETKNEFVITPFSLKIRETCV